MNDAASNPSSDSAAEVSWEIYEIGEPMPYAWSWRCRADGEIVRRSSLMYTSVHGAIEDAMKHGMKEPASAIRP